MSPCNKYCLCLMKRNCFAYNGKTLTDLFLLLHRKRLPFAFDQGIHVICFLWKRHNEYIGYTIFLMNLIWKSYFEFIVYQGWFFKYILLFLVNLRRFLLRPFILHRAWYISNLLLFAIWMLRKNHCVKMQFFIEAL